jgi:hypothetical protein
MLVCMHSQFLVVMIYTFGFNQRRRENYNVYHYNKSFQLRTQVHKIALCTQYFLVTLVTERLLKFAGHILSQSEHQLPYTDNKWRCPTDGEEKGRPKAIRPSTIKDDFRSGLGLHPFRCNSFLRRAHLITLAFVSILDK